MPVFDRYHEDFADDDDRDDDVRRKFCNRGGLSWEDNGSGFRLYDENHKKHVCPERNKPTPDDFDAL